MSNSEEITDNKECNDLSRLNRTIRTQASDPTVRNLCDRIKKGRLITQADFQRKYVWKNDTKLKSRLIESVFLEVPIPTIYTAEEDDGSEVVIDGQQRLMTFYSFLNNEFRLSGLEVCKELNHNSYKTLGMIKNKEPYQEKIDNYPLRIIKILKDSDSSVRFDIFERLNRGSVKLNDQELRNCVYRGPFNDFIKQMAINRDFQILLGSKEQSRMQDAELVLRFFTLYEMTYLKYKPNMKRFITTFMKVNQYADEDKIDKLKKVFRQSVQMVKTVFGEKAFCLYTNKDSKLAKFESVINKGLFDVLMYGFTVYNQNQVMPYKDAIKEELLWLMSNDDFLDVITGAGTDGKNKLQTKFEIWLSSLKNIVGHPQKEPRYFSWEFKNTLWQKNPVCSICDQKIEQIDDSEIDHIEFYWRGGKTIPDNARLTHRFCNRSRKKNENRVILRKNPANVVNLDSVTEVEREIRNKVHFLFSKEKGDYWEQCIPDNIKIKIGDRIKYEISIHPYEKHKYESNIEKLSFCDIRDYHKIIRYNWPMFEKIFYSQSETEKHFNNLAEYRNKDKHGRDMDTVTKKMGEAAIEWIGKTLELVDNPEMGPS